MPDSLWDLGWVEYHNTVEAKVHERAYAMEGHRLVATQVYNMLAEQALKPWQYFPLVIDENISVSTEKIKVDEEESDEDFLARMKANNYYQKPSPPSE